MLLLCQQYASSSSTTKEVATTCGELEGAKHARSEAQALLEVAGGQLESYKLKICDLETSVALKEQELKRRADLLEKQEAMVQHLSEAKFVVMLLAKQWEKRHRGLEVAANSEYSFAHLCRPTCCLCVCF